MPQPGPFDVVALGELVVDLVPARGADGEWRFAPKPGGAPGSAEELALMAGTADVDQALERLWRPRSRLAAVTFGPGGALLASANLRARVPGFAVDVVDTVACGDAFVASVLGDLARSEVDLGSPEGLMRLGRRACAAGAIAATAAGAIDGLPTAAERESFLSSRAGCGRPSPPP